MNECELYQELISRLVDGELNKNEYAALKEHMENCSDCSAMYAIFASLSDIIGSEDEPLPEDLHENIMAGVRRHAMINHNRRRLSKPMRNTLAAAACAALVLFAARGLSPAQKAQDAVLNESQTAAMDAAVQTEAAEESLPAPVQSPELTVTAKPSATPVPTASPVPTKDAYLDSGEDKTKSDKANTTNTNSGKNTNTAGGSVLVTPAPKEIIVATPSPTPLATPKATAAPTAAPSPVPAASPVPTVAPTASPAPAAAVSENPVPAAMEEAPAAAAPASLEAEAETEAAAIEPAAEEGAAESKSGAEAAEATSPASEATAQPGVDTAQPSETPGRKFAFFSFFRNSLESDALNTASAPEAESDAGESPIPSPLPAQESGEEENEELVIKLRRLEKLTELENLVDGQEAELPEGEADESYSFCMAEPDEFTKDYKLTVHIYGEEVYYLQYFAPEDSISSRAACSAEQFQQFLDSLSDEEKAPLLSPSPSPTAEALVSPSPSQSPAPEVSASPLPSEEPEENKQ